MTHDEVWEIALDASLGGHNVELIAHDGKKFYGQLNHVDHDFLLLDGRLGFPLDDVHELTVMYVS